MPDRVMVDIETLGTEPGCAILSVGAVGFDKRGLIDEYYSKITLSSCETAGLTIDADTLEWWLNQDTGFPDVFSGGEDLSDVLWELGLFLADKDEVWANAPSFDCAILEYAFGACDIATPWEYYNERCFRTLKALPVAPELEREGEKHNALDDAKHQARIASNALARLNGVEA